MDESGKRGIYSGVNQSICEEGGIVSFRCHNRGKTEIQKWNGSRPGKNVLEKD